MFFFFRVFDTRRKAVRNHSDCREPLFFTVETGTKSWMEIVVVANFGFVAIVVQKDYEKKLNMLGVGGWGVGAGHQTGVVVRGLN
jgi:hypothetical protein